MKVMKPFKENFYGAIPYKGKFRVAWCNLFTNFRPLGDVREFSTFNEADKVAKEIANGKYPEWYSGEYVNMR